MISGFKKNNSLFKLPDSATSLIPIAARITEGSIAAVVVKGNIDGIDFFTTLSYPDFTPDGWVPDEVIPASAVSKYKFFLINADEKTPALCLNSIKEDIKKLESWLGAQ